MGPSPEVAAVRLAVRRVLGELAEEPVRRAPGDLADRAGPGPGLVLVACSGGPDSVALAAALAFEAPRAGWAAGALTVDHGLQPGSARRAGELATALRAAGLDPVEVVPTTVDGRSGAGGPEAAARTARYAALDAAADRLGATAVLLGHTLDDQAETVLLGLARGSGARSLAGMPAVRGRYRRPLLGLPRDVVRSAARESALPGWPGWEDPHNTDPAYARSRVRHDALPALEKALGPGVPAALARTADLLRADADALDGWAAGARASAEPRPGELEVDVLAGLPPAVRSRVLRAAVVDAGSPATDLTADHVAGLDRLVTRWRGQGPLDLPGRVRARRDRGMLHLSQED